MTVDTFLDRGGCERFTPVERSHPRVLGAAARCEARGVAISRNLCHAIAEAQTDLRLRGIEVPQPDLTLPQGW